MKNKLKEKLNRREKTIGTFFECGSTAVIESMGLTGLDYAVIDTEHGPFEAESVSEYVCAAERRGLTPLARVKEISRAAILKLLDVGAKGLIIPQVKTVDDVKEIVKFGKYSPVGERGVAGQRANGFAFDMGGTLEDWFRISNEETLLIPQCETIECLSDIDNIVSVEGVAGIFIGPYDLSTAMGISGQFTKPEFLSAIQKIIDVCHSHGKFVMIYCDNATKANEYFSMGVDSAAVGLDIGIMVEGYRRIVADIIGG